MLEFIILFGVSVTLACLAWGAYKLPVELFFPFHEGWGMIMKFLCVVAFGFMSAGVLVVLLIRLIYVIFWQLP